MIGYSPWSQLSILLILIQGDATTEEMSVATQLVSKDIIPVDEVTETEAPRAITEDEAKFSAYQVKSQIKDWIGILHQNVSSGRGNILNPCPDLLRLSRLTPTIPIHPWFVSFYVNPGVL